MKACAVTRSGTDVVVELRATTTMGPLDAEVLKYLFSLAQAGSVMRCELKVLDGHVQLHLSRPTLER